MQCFSVRDALPSNKYWLPAQESGPVLEVSRGRGESAHIP